jgi:nucleoside-diphosphate-sugar epimerase
VGSTIFVTGATGQTGGNVCEQLIQRGDRVRALVRNPDEASALSDIGVELVKGDIRDGDDVLRAAKGAEAAIHCAALLGGASQDLDDFKAVNMVGTTNVLDAGKAHGMRRVVALSTATFLDLSTGVDFEEAPVLDNPPKDPYTVTKLAAFSEAPACRRGRRCADVSPRRDFRPCPGRRSSLAPNQLQPGAAGGHARKDQALSRFSGDVGGGQGCGGRLDCRAGPRRGR